MIWGKIVSSSGYIQNITINNAWPKTILSDTENDPAVYGVISEIKTDTVLVNGLGEGAVWVCDAGGCLSKGDLITTSNVKGYGQKQLDRHIQSHTAARAVMDCAFDDKATKFVYELKTLVKTNSVEITSEEHLASIIQSLSPNTTYEVNIDEYNNSKVLTWEESYKSWEIKTDEQGEPLIIPEYQMRYVYANGLILDKETYNSMKLAGKIVHACCLIGCVYLCG